MAKGDHRFLRDAKGSTNGGYKRPRVQVGFDEPQFRRIAALAQRYDKSFATVVRNLVDLGLHAVGEGVAPAASEREVK